MKHSPISKFFHFAVGWSIIIFSGYWMYLCCHEHWRRSVGSQNLIILLFVLFLSVLSLLFYSRKILKAYYASVILSFIPGIIVCYLNRAARYPDIVKMVETFNNGHLNDPTYIGYINIYSTDFLQYEYIVSRSSTSSTTLFILQVIWLILLVYNFLFPNKNK